MTLYDFSEQDALERAAAGIEGLDEAGVRAWSELLLALQSDGWVLAPVKGVEAEERIPRRPASRPSHEQRGRVSLMPERMKLRAVFGHLPGDTYPCCIGAMDATRWKLMGDDEWQSIVSAWKKDWDRNDWQSYDYREAFIDFPVPSVAAPVLTAVQPDKEG